MAQAAQSVVFETQRPVPILPTEYGSLLFTTVGKLDATKGKR
jgi:hypothetical protein